MRNLRSRAREMMCLAVACACWPAAAAAQGTPGEAGEPPLRIGPVEVRPRLVLSNIGFDNNVFNQRENPKSDFTLTAAPDVELAVNPRRLRLSLLSGSEFVYFRKYTSERSANRSLTTRAELDLRVLRPFASYSTSHTSARAGSEIDIRARHHPRAAAAGTRVAIASRTSMVLSAGRRWEEFNPDEVFRGESLAAALNSRTTALEGSLVFALTPLTSLSLVTVREQTRFDLSPVRDADSIRAGPTLSFSPLGLLSGTASVGYRRFTGKDPALQTYAGLVASGTLSALLGERFKLDTAFNRDVAYSYEASVPYYVISGGRASLATRVGKAIDVRVSGGREVMQYRALAGLDSPGSDTVDTYGGGVGYRIADRIQFAVLAEYRNRHSTRHASRAYDNNRIFATLSWGVIPR